MSIAQFIRDSVLRSRLKEATWLALCYIGKRYRNLRIDLAAETAPCIKAKEA